MYFSMIYSSVSLYIVEEIYDQKCVSFSPTTPPSFWKLLGKDGENKQMVPFFPESNMFAFQLSKIVYWN